MEASAADDIVAVDNRHFGCRVCKQRVKGLRSFQRHFRLCALRERRFYECILCHTNFDSRNLFDEHISSCHVSEFSNGGSDSSFKCSYKCTLCHKIFVTRTKFNKHMKSCKQRPSIHLCKKCKKPFASVETLQSHRKQCRISGAIDSGSNVRRAVKCRQCLQEFADRKLLWRHRRLYHHQQQQRGGGGGLDLLQSEPWRVENDEDLVRPWTDDQGNVIDEPLQDIYNTHRDIILAAHNNRSDRTETVHGGGGGPTTKIMQTFNFPLSGNEDGPESINFKGHLTYIFKQERQSFKVNLAFGIILRHTETGEYRYFIAYRNTNIFERPLLISNFKSIGRVVKRIVRKSLDDHILQQRPNTKWTPVFVTNVVYSVYLTSYTLGNEATKLPKWLKCKKCIVLTNGKHMDSLCAFRCLAYHQKQQQRHVSLLKNARIFRGEKLTLKLFRKWVQENANRNKNNSRMMTPDNFSGVKVPDDMPLFEKLFNVRVNVFSLEDCGQTCIPIYLSCRKPAKGISTLNMNCYENHLSYITKLVTYTKRYKCQHCDQFFKTAGKLKRHEKGDCSRRTKLTFPGGYFTPSQTIFDQLQDICDINVPKEEQMFDYFIMMDGEALLLKVEESSGSAGGTKWTARHHPISISMCSNVPGFEEPKCVVASEIETLLRNAVEYMSEIAAEAKRLTEIKLETTLNELQKLVDDFRVRKMTFVNTTNSSSSKHSSNRCGEDSSEMDDEPSDEPMSAAMKHRLSKPNVFHDMMQRLCDETNSDDVTVNYNEWNELQEDDVQCRSAAEPSPPWTKEDEQQYSQIRLLWESMTHYCRQIPVLGFNSSNYDLNLWKSKVARALAIVEGQSSSTNAFVIKRNNQYVCLSNNTFKILDLSQYLPPGTSYAKFLSTFKVPQSKGFMCYEYLDDENKLSETHLPPLEAFWSRLKNVNTLADPQRNIYEKLCLKHPDKTESELLLMLNLKAVPKTAQDNYDFLKTVWEEKQMKSLKDLLIWYNNLDVLPGVEAVKRLKSFYWSETGIDILKDCLSAPGIARKLIFKMARDNEANFALFNTANSDLYEVVKQGICGGPSILFCRRHKAGETYLRGNKEKVCGSCIGYDCNALYLHCIGQDMPVSHFIRWLPKGNGTFESKKSERYTSAYDWLDWEAKQRGIHIQHKLNSGREKRIGPYFVDGYDPLSKTCFEYYGCWFHQDIKESCTVYTHPPDDSSRPRYERTIKREAYIRSQGFQITSMWECTFRKMCETDRELKHFLRNRQHEFTARHGKKTVRQETLLRAVRNDVFFGLVQVDIHVPSNLYDHFSEMSPLFATCNVPFSKIGPHMQKHAEKQDLDKKDRVLLVGGMKAQELLLATPLLRWYLEHGLVVTKIHQAVEYGRKRCFKSFMEKVTTSRRMGDVDPDFAIMGELWKLIGNSAYGSLLLDRTKHQKCHYVHGDIRAMQEINNARFISLCPLSDCDFEILSAKKSIKMDLPLVLGFYILQYAKQRILEFYYQFLDTFVDRENFELLQMDTDSLYFAITGKCLQDVIKPEKRAAYEHMLKGFCDQEDIESDSTIHFLPRDCCSVHAKRDKRTPGLFKLESQGTEMVSLNSKTYALFQDGEQVKLSSKGLNKRNIVNAMNTYHAVLQDQQTRCSKNIGFRARNNTVYTYTQFRNAISYFYVKRLVLEDRVSTRPLDMVLKPISSRK